MHNGFNTLVVFLIQESRLLVMEKKLNKNALRSKKLIRQAFLTLLKKKKTQDISITELVNEANINRATFYAHYSCLKDLVEEIENEVIDKMLELMKNFKIESFFSNPTPPLLQVSLFLNENVDYYKTLLTSDNSDLFLEKLLSIFVNYMENDQSISLKIRESKTFKIRVHYFAGGMVSLYKEWFNGNLDCSLFDIPLEVAKMLQNENNNIMR